jgi:hypothetical protein
VVGEVEETVELRAARLALVLSPVPQEVVDIALAERSFHLRPARFRVRLMDNMKIVRRTEPRVSLSCERRPVELERAEMRRYTDTDQ